MITIKYCQIFLIFCNLLNTLHVYIDIYSYIYVYVYVYTLTEHSFASSTAHVPVGVVA